MTRRPPVRSAASRVFVAVSAAVVVVVLVVAGILALETQRAARAEAERVTIAVSATLAGDAEVQAGLAAADPTAVLQPLAERVMADAPVDFVTILRPDGVRVAHRDPDEIGRPYLGTIPATPVALTEEFTGTLGPSLRTIMPVEHEGTLVGWVSVGVTLGSIWATVVPRLLVVLGIATVVVAAGFFGAFLARRTTRRVTGDLAPDAIRDTLASAESMRTLGEALRAQTHEHGNRMHTAVALLELGRTDQAIALLTESSRQSQELVDQVAARREGDPTVGALLLGKAAQAAERGVELTADIAPDAPRSVLAPIDQVALVGNLIDNALDAAAAGSAPRWVRVAMARSSADELALAVSDSGDGVAEELRGRIFERGFSTKPADGDGRGVGLALVRAIVAEVDGTVTLDASSPTTFRVVLPTEVSA